ncbi:hypothetical protein [Sphingosinicella terrae]|uniref:hypothetical protein n=1 Tax=Sphingosinicella terrae TaxID=2172047 RepID=UPI000E0D2E4F|nr:hypothetical protein [Sphingosinicella terrae]
MTAPGRRIALCAQAVRTLTGIDFVQVVDPADQRVLRVFFIIDPEETVPPMVAPGAVPAVPGGADEGPDVPAVAPLGARIETAAGAVAADIAALRWRRIRTFDAERVALEIEVVEPGGFEPYRLVIEHPRMDVLGGTLLFDFKQACETGFDCEADPDCPGDPLEDVAVDYLARDFDSIRLALLDFTRARYPDWREPIEADTAVMLMEVMAALGDEFAYQQDRIDAETRFASATQRASLAALARLVDYRVDRGAPAGGDIAVTAIGAGGTLPADTPFWARPDAVSSIPFSTIAGIWLHPRWNIFPAHNPDPEQDCLGHGLTSLMLQSAPAVAAETPAGVTREEFLVGKKVFILSDPGAERPKRAVPVTIIAVNEFVDPLILTAGNPTFVTRIHWDRSEATRVELPYDGLTVAMNVVPVAAGEAVTEHFRIGTGEELAASIPVADPVLAARMQALPPAVEREGSIDAARAGRDIVFRYGLRASEGQSLRHRADGSPEIVLTEIEPPAVLPAPLPVDDPALFALFVEPAGAPSWDYLDDPLDGDVDDTVFTLEPGMWRTVRRYQLPFGTFDFQDYASDSGWTVRFGSGAFGQPPAVGAIVRARYLTDPGVTANVASETLSAEPPEGVAVSPAVAALVGAVTNPLPFGNARAEEDAATIRLLAPEAYRAMPRRAVRPEDYSEIIERMPFVQRASSTTRWTGSWSTDFVAVDPLDSIALTPVQAAAVDTEIECIRMAARDARRVEPDYLDIDIEIRVCVAANAFAGEVVEALYEAIAAPGFFAPNNFTFGTPLSRSSLEAAAQAVPGVRFVDSIRIRVRGLGDWRDFSETALVPEAGQIIRLQNDPDRAALGLLRIKSDGGR